MRRRCVALALCLALLAGVLPLAGALAEEKPWFAGFFDYYYHAHQDCALAGTVSPVSAEEADAQGKFPCPACVDDAAKYKGVEATIRGGTLVIRVPDAWAAERDGGELTTEWKGFWAGGSTGERAAATLAELLHGAGYRAFLDALARRGEAASGPVLGREESLPCAECPDIEENDGALLMHRRHIGAAWYLTYRPGAEARKALDKKKKLDLPLGFDVYELRMWDDGTLDTRYSGSWTGKATTVKPKKSKGETRFEGEAGDLTLAIYPDMDVNICVIHWKGAGDEWLESLALTIDGAACMYHLKGYADGGDAIFCGVLTEGEAWALESGAAFALERVDRLYEVSPDADGTADAIEAGFATAFEGE